MTMKKIYFAPKTEIVEVETQSLLNIVSNGDNTLNGGGSQGYLGGGDEVLSRRGYDDFWDDEEEY